MPVLSTLLFAGLAFGAGYETDPEYQAAFNDEGHEEYRAAFEDEDLGVPALGAAPRDHLDEGFKRLPTCPGSGARQHTRAQMKVVFANSCADVSAEILARANGADGWKDSHNRGTYTVLNGEGSLLKIKRRTGNNKYTDVQTFSLSALGDKMCNVAACSVSQGNSNNDAGTNMCDMMNLFCNSETRNNQNGLACKPVKTDLTYSIPKLQCGRYTNNGQYLAHYCQDFATTCLKQPQTAAEGEELEVPVLQGAPRDYHHTMFRKFNTCPGSGAREHTMAQSTIEFANSCADVSAEIQARANGEGGFKDPHNRGKYTLLASNANYIKIKRRTGNNKYTDVQTFSLKANGANGCSVNACSESQGNSNNDAGTNMCDMSNLYCNSSEKNGQNGIACKPVKTDLTYAVSYLECGRYRGDGQYRQHNCQNLAQTCLRQPPNAEADEAAEESVKVLRNLGEAHQG